MRSKAFVLLTFDVEEFDLPIEYNDIISMDEQLAIGKKGLNEILSIVEQCKVSATLFTTAHFANNNKDEIKKAAYFHEIASHCYYHGSFKEDDVIQSKIILEQIIEKEVVGFRMPRFKQIEKTLIKNAGYLYDSSINPTYIPGRYNNLNKSTKALIEDEITIVPVSVTPFFRFPLFWLSFKNLPYWIYKRLALYTLKKQGFLSLYFHPWEFIDITSYKIPSYTKKNCKGILSAKLIRLINELKQNATFITMQDYITDHI
ncbi:polysaccharide deacetylase family protein [Ferruginibacter yonginensis]|uniref:Polysaccharide deacetylase family protein n=1 Tax=Ferruginibacter yonginensis TaxID=1310416 RepID=A0ABV8QMX6_9BACT